MPTVDYSPLTDWIRANRQTYQAMAKTARDRGAKIHADTIGRWISVGKPLPGEVILSWREAFGWSWEQTVHYCLGGPPHLMYEPEKISPEERAFLKASKALFGARK